MAEGTHPYLERIKKADLPMVIVSADTLQRSDGAAIMNYINKLAENTNLINKQEGWNGINVLHNEAARVGALDIGIIPQRKLRDKKAKVVYLLGADNFRHEDIPEDAFIIYQGHTGDEGAYYADLILPAASYIEKTALYVNTDGRVQQARQALAPPGFAREDWQILRALSEELNCPLPYDSIDEIRSRIAELAPHLVKVDYVENSGFEKLAHRTNDAATEVTAENVDDSHLARVV